MSEIILIRHGATAGNRRKRYIGITDEPLLRESIRALKSREYPKADVVFLSPLLRCVQTSEAIYPNIRHVIVPELRECDFGMFENKNYIELSDSPEYRKWIDSGGMLPFPGGEAHEDFKRRCIDAFIESASSCGVGETAAFVIHGGTIMAIMERFASPGKSFYEWHVENGGGYVVSNDNGHGLTVIRAL